MKNRIKKSYRLETIFKALIITNLINIIIKELGLPILILLLSLFLFQNLNGNTVENYQEKSKIENTIPVLP